MSKRRQDKFATLLNNGGLKTYHGDGFTAYWGRNYTKENVDKFFASENIKRTSEWKKIAYGQECSIEDIINK